MVVKGKIIKCKRESKEFKGQKTDKKLFITLADVKLTDEQLEELREAFKDSGKKFTPDWVLEPENGYVNVSTKYDLPAQLYPNNAEVNSIEDAIADGYEWNKAEVSLSLKVKEGAVYPVAIRFRSEGTPTDFFGEFDEEG